MTRFHRATDTARFTFVIRADNHADVLPTIVLLFHRLNVEIDALYMLRRRGSESMRVDITIEANRELCRQVEAELSKVASVRSAKTERCSKELFSDSNIDESKGERRS
jgi:acetolactate synthase small subunit